MSVVVFDAGIWISAIRFGGLPRQAIEKAVLSDQIAVSKITEQEIVRGLVRRLGYPQIDAEDIVVNLLERTLVVPIDGRISGACRDPKDDHVLECAVTGDAQLLVTGDKDLSRCAHFKTYAS